MKNIFITGATGFIGGHLVDANLEKKYNVRVLVRRNSPDAASITKKPVDIIYGDIRDGTLMEKACSGIDIIFHCAALVTDWGPNRLFHDVNVNGTENLCKAALKNKVKCFVDISTNDVFGFGTKNLIDESFPLRSWKEPYPDSKIAAEKIVWHYHRDHALPVTMVYPCWVFGPRDKTFLPHLAESIINHEFIFWRRDSRIWPTYIDNLVDLLMTIAEDKRAVGNGYLVHDGESIKLEDFCANIANALDVPPVTAHVPYFAAYAVGLLMEAVWKLLRKKTRPLITTYLVKNFGSCIQYSIEKAERELGWKPRISFNKGFAESIKWLKSQDVTSLKKK